MTNEVLIAMAVFFAVFLFSAASLLTASNLLSSRSRISERLFSNRGVVIKTRNDLVKIRRKRGLSSEGHYRTHLTAFNRLVLQSGSSIGLMGWVMIMASMAFGAFLVLRTILGDFWLSLVFAILIGIALPVSILKSLREKRQKHFEELLPEAIDVLVRSLKAGHSISVAIDMVAKHMPEPISTEFKLTAAELTYGLDLETALVNLSARVGQQDLMLIVIAVSIQSKTGGNLTEILRNLSGIIRERLKLRRKAYALSAEGRFSAIVLSVLPFILFAVLLLISPNYYGDVWNNPYVKPVLGASILWMLLGDWIMFRMVQIKI